MAKLQKNLKRLALAKYCFFCIFAAIMSIDNINSKIDFNAPVDRRGTGCVKFDNLKTVYGREDLTPLWVADMDFEVAPAISKALDERMKHHVYGYAISSPGYYQSIINWVGNRYDLEVTPDEITYIPGIVRGIALAVNYFTRPGDKILIQPPVYHPFRNISEGNNRVVVENPLVLHPDGSYSMDLDGLRKTVETERPKLMILCNPHNPAGIQWDEETLREVARIAAANDMIVISDEIHGDLMLDGKRHVSFPTVSREASDVSIVFGAPSKTFNIAGLVSSWAVIKNPAVREGFFHWLEVNEFNAPTFFATIATEAAYNQSASWLDDLLVYMAGNIDFMEQWFAQNLPAVKVLRPDASFLVWLDCRDLGLDHDKLVELMTDKARLALNDGAMFGKEGSGFMRFNAGTRREVIKTALEQLKQAVESL